MGSESPWNASTAISSDVSSKAASIRWSLCFARRCCTGDACFPCWDWPWQSVGALLPRGSAPVEGASFRELVPVISFCCGRLRKVAEGRVGKACSAVPPRVFRGSWWDCAAIVPPYMHFPQQKPISGCVPRAWPAACHAAPSSIASAACRAHSTSEGDRPTVHSAAAALATTMSRGGPRRPCENFANHPGTFLRSGNEHGLPPRRFETEIGRLPLESLQAAAGGLDHLGRAAEGDFVQAVRPVYDQSTMDAQQQQRLGQQRLQFRPPHAEQLEGGRGRIHQRAKDVEDRGRAESLADRRHVLHRGVQQRGEAEADAQVGQAGLDPGHVGLDVHAQGGQHVGRAAAAGDAAVAVLGHGHAGRRGDQGGRRGDIEGLRAVAAGAAGVDQVARGMSGWASCAARMAAAAPATSATVSPLRCKAASSRAICVSSACAVHDPAHRGRHLLHRQIAARFDDLDGRFQHRQGPLRTSVARVELTAVRDFASCCAGSRSDPFSRRS